MEIKDSLVVVLPMLMAIILLIGYSTTSPSTNLRSSTASFSMSASATDGTCATNASPVMGGFDVISFFEKDAKAGKLGSVANSAKYNDYTFYFESKENKQLFETKPEAYIPQFGGFSAFDVAKSCTFSLEDSCLTVIYGGNPCPNGKGPFCAVESQSPINKVEWLILDQKLYFFPDELAKRSFTTNLIGEASKNWEKYGTTLFNTVC